MTPEEQQKADAWMLLTDKDAVTNRIGKVMVEIFENPSSARWLSQRLIDADKQSVSPPMRMYFEGQLERNLRMILAEGVQSRLEEIVMPLLDDMVRRHANTISKELNDLKKLKSKGPIHGRR
jgi:hypothetical protein